ncbi:DNA polymerase III subunit delta [Candidatus Azambacteria bacterium RIFCSPHIGHO2_02_FULL_52_12]|uniref:DNA-directed DNA polymerase n=1 Tax=Candidatus Azambacteria bacterium RIFCSPLOWO2_01_FULL_46_25 TaxID=1797298 RepID=A0A1F5BV37_9BACT|nr:MAG: DNA polymerase III subunit delta [Candidatus Azambacteria bacterium RIFCSPHIGHO2_02_FULL_52_12]OGD34438.1 MAG: DNA polymerase III subunit delta [Candidatus Azambacteria bacterium RIFCSPLOWO2_01_FULL_46_25]OGD37284.1 MAG: DNA polymerase III subunit delta [Candidatus Azambacteria bacterium RIFCSPHIGHO2_01_FULL_51_74]
MIIILHGENSLFAKRKLGEIIASYKTKHKSGLSFFVFDEDADFGEVKSAWETVSMFEEKKLLVFKDVLGNAKQKTAITEFLRGHRAKEDKDRVAVFSERTPVEIKRDTDAAWLLEVPSVVQESKHIGPARLPLWITEEAKRWHAAIDPDAAAYLVSACGNDLWRLSNEVAKLASYGKRITKRNAQLLVRYDAHAQIFDAVSALAEKRTALAMRQFYALLSEEEWAGMLGLIIFQFRNILRVRILLDEEASPAEIKSSLKLHPFVLQKTAAYARLYTGAGLKALYGLLCDMDVALKTSKASFEPCLEQFALRVSGVLAK